MWVMISWLFVGRLVKKGLFGDGLLYASMSRNMAEGRGSWWQPYFSSSYWIEGMPTYYYENPPLMLWLESLLFRVSGDHWWVEKLFCVFVFVANVLAIRYLWMAISKYFGIVRQHWPLAVVFWMLIPVSLWGNVNNMMDNLMLTFCLLSTAFILIACYDNNALHRNLYVIGAAISIYLGVLAKGPVALYPLAFPGILWFCRLSLSLSRATFTTIGATTIFVSIFALMLYLIPASAEYFKIYWEQRLKAVIVGSRADDLVSGWARFYIIYQIFLESSVLLGLLIIIWFTNKWQKITSKSTPKLSWTFVLLGLAASLPILASTKQSGIYLIPGLPMFSIGFGIWISEWFGPFLEKKLSTLMTISFISLSVVGIVVASLNFGTYRREAGFIKDIEDLRNHVSVGSRIGVCDKSMHDFMVQTYMQRMGKYELTTIGSNPPFIMIDKKCTSTEIDQIASYVKLNDPPHESWQLYKEK